MLSYYIVYFFIYSFIGYVYECIAMMLWSGKWESRGFLFGPIIPIYGFGAFIGLILFGGAFKQYSPLAVFLTGFFGSILLEYPTSVILEKAFHAVWWDYSIAPFNINGRVSLFSSIGFGIGGLIIVYLLNPIICPWLKGLNPILLEVISYILIALVSIDTATTIAVLSDFEDRVDSLDKFINEHVDTAVETINPKRRNIKNAIIYTKENVIDNVVEKYIDNKNRLYYSVISRVKSFKDSSSSRAQTLKSKIKERIDTLRDKDER